MSNLLLKDATSTESEEYRKLVSTINRLYEELQNTIKSCRLKESKLFLEVSYKCFIEKVQKDIVQ